MAKKRNRNQNSGSNNNNPETENQAPETDMQSDDKVKDTKKGKPQAAKKVTYISRYLQLRLVRKGAYKKEVEGQIMVMPGKSIQFRDGVFETEDAEEIQFLDNHKNCGNIFIRIEKGDAKRRREDKYKDLETREREMKNKIARLQEENKRLKDENEEIAKGREEGDDAGEQGTEDPAF